MDELLNGDEEQAYVLYMRFLDVYKSICASKEYRRDKTEVNKLLPHSKVQQSVCVHVYVHMHEHVCIYECVHVCVLYLCMSVCAFICMYECVCVCACACLCVHVCVYVCMSVCMCVCMCMYVCVCVWWHSLLIHYLYRYLSTPIMFTSCAIPPPVNTRQVSCDIDHILYLIIILLRWPRHWKRLRNFLRR